MTKQQMSAKNVVVISFWKEKRTAWPVLFLKEMAIAWPVLFLKEMAIKTLLTFGF
jgi:hypothetical protein